jgi:hypothetical protein
LADRNGRSLAGNCFSKAGFLTELRCLWINLYE